MALLKAEAAKLSNNKLLSGVIEELIDQEDLFVLLPFTQVMNKAYVFNRENTGDYNNTTGIEANFVDVSSAASNNTIREATATFINIVTQLTILAGDVDIDKFLQTTMSDTTDQKTTQLALRAKGMARTFRRMLITGSSSVSALQFDGLQRWLTSDFGGHVHNTAQTIDLKANATTPGALTLEALDWLLDQVPMGADVIMMAPSQIRKYKTLIRALGGFGADASMTLDPRFGRPILTHNGVPIIRNEFITTNNNVGAGTSANSGDIYAVRLNELDGFHGLYGGPNAGIQVENVGTVQDRDAERIRLKWYCGTALKSTKSLARLTNVISQ